MFLKIFRNGMAIYLTIIITSFSQEIVSIEKNLIIINGRVEKDNFAAFESIDLLDFYFDGYLIIANKLPLKTDEHFLCSKVYWVQYLEHIDSSDYYYYYYPLLADAISYNAYMSNNLYKTKDSSKIAAKSFCKYYSLFSNPNQRICSFYLYEPRDWLYSDSLNNCTSFWKKDNEYFYAIYKCSFRTSVATVSIPLTLIDGTKIDIVKIFVPISQLYSSNQITEKEALDAGLTKSNILIRTK